MSVAKDVSRLEIILAVDYDVIMSCYDLVVARILIYLRNKYFYRVNFVILFQIPISIYRKFEVDQ